MRVERRGILVGFEFFLPERSDMFEVRLRFMNRRILGVVENLGRFRRFMVETQGTKMFPEGRGIFKG